MPSGFREISANRNTSLAMTANFPLVPKLKLCKVPPNEHSWYVCFQWVM